jgi:hypothetical protein
MYKLIAVFIVGFLLIPQASFAATYGSENYPSNATLQAQINVLFQQIERLQARLTALEKPQLGSVTAPVPDKERTALEKELKKIMGGSSWKSCTNSKPCESKIKRVNEIRTLLDSQNSCGYQSTRKGPPVLVCQ